MNKHVFASALAVVCASTVAAWAQAGRSNTSPSATNRFVVIGCVSRAPAGTTAAGRGRGAATAPRFLITDTRGETPTVYQLQGDASQLELHVGHTMEIAGPLSAPAGAAAGAQKPNLTLKAESLTWIATKCGK